MPTKFVFKFKGDVSSLAEGTQIKYKGFEVGKIKKLKIKYNKEYKGFEAESLGIIDISNFSTNKEDAFKNFKALVKNGIVAKLEKPNPLFNKSNIVLEEDNSSKVELKKDSTYNAYIIPTKEYKDSGLIGKLAEITDKINKLDLEHTVASINSVIDSSKKPIKNLNKVLVHTQELVKNANKTLKSINKTVNSKDFRGLSKSLNRALRDLRSTLKTTKRTLKGYDSNSLFADKVEATLNELHNTTEETNNLLRKLNKKPNALIFGE